MSNRSRTIKEIPVENNPDVNLIRVGLSFTKGRGLFLSVQPMKVTHERGYISTKYIPTSGVRTLVKEMKRFSAKVLETFEPDPALLAAMVERVQDA